MLLRRAFSRALAPRLLILALIASTLTATAADAAAVVPRADRDLSTRVDAGGTGSSVATVSTPALRDAAARSSSAPRILVIGTGVARSVFPPTLQNAITVPRGLDATDPHGYGTLAASVILQLIPNAVIESRAVGARDILYTQLRLEQLTDALTYARANRSRFDAVLLAFPPQAVLSPAAHMLGRVDFGSFGSGLSLLSEAMVVNAGRTTEGAVIGIPEDRALRARLFAGANLKHRDAIERYAAAVAEWRAAVGALEALTDTGVAVVAPSGDLSRVAGGQLLPLPTQTVFGLSAHPDVITVGASYADGARQRISPTSGRGPTLDLAPKPDVVAPAGVMAMVPGKASLPWSDDSTRVPLARLDWASGPPTPCPSITNAYRCVLQGSAMTSASVVAANVAALVASGTPNRASARDASDDEILRGIVAVEASRHRAIASDANRDAFGWEQGAGVLSGLRAFDRARTPVPLARADLGTVGPRDAASTTIGLWSGGARAASAATAFDSFLGVDPTGAAVPQAHADSSRPSARASASSITVEAAPARADGGVYAGRVTLTGASGDTVSIPLHLLQGVDVDFHVDYAYNEFQTGGIEGERVERATAMLFADMPPTVGLVGEAFKNLGSQQFKRIGGDPTNGPIIRYATTRDSFADPSVAPADHGRGTIRAVPPGFYKIHILTDHTVTAEQARGTVESLGIQIASTGPEAAIAPGASLLVPSEGPCPGGSSGPLAGCVERGGEIDTDNGLCVARNGSTGVEYRYYCGEIAFAVPSAIVSRAVHHIEHDADPARSEWETCNVPLPTNGAGIDLAAIVGQSEDCDPSSPSSSWEIGTKAPRCLGPAERKTFSAGHPNDVRARFRSLVGQGAPGSVFPAAVMTYEFALPYLNTYTNAGLAFSYVAENAIVGVRFQTGNRATDDASHGLLIVDDPDIDVTPVLPKASARGSIFTGWEVMSSNAEIGRLSLIVIPTVWPGVGGTTPAATVELCDVSLRVSTYAKQGFGDPTVEGGRHVQFFPTLDRGLASQIDPATSRVRAVWDARSGSFVDRGAEPETLHLAVQIPKNTTTKTSVEHHVRSPRGGPAHLTAARRWGTDARRHEAILPAGFETYDPRGGYNELRCQEGPATIGAGEDPNRIARWGVCRAWNDARGSNEIIAGLFEDIWSNGRFAGLLSLDHATIARAAGNVAFEFADADDGGAFEQRWATKNGAYQRSFPVPNFYDDKVGELSLSLLGGVVSVAKNGGGHYELTVGAGVPGGQSYSISTEL